MAIPPLNTAFAKLFRTGDVQNFSSTHAREGGVVYNTQKDQVKQPAQICYL